MGRMKFMLTLPEEQYKLVAREAKKREVTVQDVIRVLIIPEWKKQRYNATRKKPENGGDPYPDPQPSGDAPLLERRVAK
jgi:hypothetical protein